MRLFTTILLTALFVVAAVAQEITSIYDIQYTDDPSGDSPLVDQVVTVSGIVSSEHRGDVRANGGISGSYFFIMDSAGAWSGIQIHYSDMMVAEGDSVTLTGTVGEYYGQSQIGSVSDLTIHSSGHEVPGPVIATTGAIDTSEAYEGCLVRVEDVVVTEIEIGSYDNWKVDDGSGSVLIDTRAKYYYTPEMDAPIKSLTGIVLYGYGAYSIAPRLAWDVEEGGEFTRLQRVQQIRNSDLIKTLEDEVSDISYAYNDTVTIKGIVTMPTGLSYAGDGIKFILSEPAGGPWSAVLSYNPDSTAYPTLFEGDLVEMTGYVFEYSSGPANMTELFITSPINIIDFGLDLPPTSKVNTGDLRIPETAEQWGNVFVYTEQAEILDYGGQYEIYGIDDGTGYALIDDDSDSIQAYYDPERLGNAYAPLGTIIDSARGWVYHHYGSYSDSSVYKLVPNYISDLAFGAGPPLVADVMRDVAILTAESAVTISAEIKTNATITEAALYYDVALDGSSSGYSMIAMTNTEGNIYEGTIPAKALGSFVSYFVSATDDIAQTTVAPSDTTVQNFCYKVTDGTLTIADIQYTPWEIADSPFEGQVVTITGVVTNDTSANNRYEAYSIQDAEEPWSGIFVFGIGADLVRGDEITVTGTVTDYNPDWDFKWGANTVILAESFTTNSSGNTVDPIMVTTGELNSDSEAAEAYEGMLVQVLNATLTAVNGYDAAFDDGSGECLVDGDFMLARDQDPNEMFYVNDTDGYLVAAGDTLMPGSEIDMISGIFTYSFGSYKIELRTTEDFGNLLGIDKDFEAKPLSYNLGQNYPNPFNPSTNIYFEIPNAEPVKIVVYNVLGQKMRTLIDASFNAGRHIVNWNGLTDAGERVPSGIYLYRIKAGEYIDSRKMMLVK